jgi:transcription initiation factor TFIIH subunit 2
MLLCGFGTSALLPLLTLIYSQNAEAGAADTCHGCAQDFPTTLIPAVGEAMSALGRYRCPECHKDFCSECDVFIHDVVHFCPGCDK